MARLLTRGMRLLAAWMLWSLPLYAAIVGRVTTIDYPGATQTLAFGMNTAGDVVGSYIDAAGMEHGFVLRDGAFTAFDYTGAFWTEGWGSNSKGEIAGQYGLMDMTMHGFRLRNGEFTPVEVPGQPNTMPQRIGPDGTIVGCYHVNTSSGSVNLDTMHGFAMTASGAVTAYPPARTMNNGINPQGDIVGDVFDATGRIHGYVIHGGTTTTFDFPGITGNTRAWDMNASGEVVGFYVAGVQHGYMRKNGAFISFDVPGAARTFATGTNALGDIVGRYADSKGLLHGFVVRR